MTAASFRILLGGGKNSCFSKPKFSAHLQWIIFVAFIFRTTFSTEYFYCNLLHYLYIFKILHSVVFHIIFSTEYFYCNLSHLTTHVLIPFAFIPNWFENWQRCHVLVFFKVFPMKRNRIGFCAKSHFINFDLYIF